MLNINCTESEVKKARAVLHHLNRCGSLLIVRKNIPPLREIEVLSKQGRIPKLDPKKRTEELLKLYREGLAFSFIAKKLRMSVGAVVKCTTENGIVRTHKQCVSCNKVRPVSQFHKATRNADGMVGRCRICMNTYMKVWSESR